MMRSIALKQSVKEHIMNHCMKKKPHEACGFLLGVAGSCRINIEDFIAIPNISSNPSNQFSMDPIHLIPLVTPSSSRSKVVGILHSHPNAAPIPSHEDLQTSWYPLPSHWIVSLQDKKNPVMIAYRYLKPQINDRCSAHHLSYYPIPIIVTDDT